MVIQIWNTLKSEMGLQDQAFKNCNKWMPPYKERKSNLDKCLSPYLSIIYRKAHQISHEITPPIYKMGDQNVKMSFISWFFVTVFSFGCVYTINCGLNK